MLVALAVVTAASLNPPKPAVSVVCLVRAILIKTRMHAGLACGFVSVFGRDGIWENRIADVSRRRSGGGSRRGGRRGPGCRRSGGGGSAFCFAEVVPFHPI